MSLDEERRIRDIQDRLTVRQTETSGGAGTAFPTGIAAGFMFFRTNLGLLCYYDGSQWLTVHEYSAEMRTDLTALSATNAFVNIASLRTDYAPAILRIAHELFVGGTSNATNYWTIVLYGYNNAFTANSVIDSFDTKTVTASTWTRVERSPNTNAVPTNNAEMVIDITKTLAPGNLSILTTVYYRLIVT
jgi:hypothetical protein